MLLDLTHPDAKPAQQQARESQRHSSTTNLCRKTDHRTGMVPETLPETGSIDNHELAFAAAVSLIN
jgi:hypothetical protein